MKEAFWGVLIVSLGIFGIVAVNLFQTVTVDNDRVYYVLKESTEASAYDAIDLTYYRLTGNLRIVEDKFAENIARRFAENITMGDYKIIIADINEMPPKVSLWVRSGITSLQGEKFELVNAVNGILETKYTFEDIEDYVGVTEEEWINIKDVDVYEKEEDETICDEIVTEDEMECIPGDIKFTGWGSVLLEESICDTDTPKKNVEREAKYKVCDCGKWSEEKVDKVYANPVTNYMNRTHNYTWTFNKKGDIREINETVTETVRIDVCTTAIEIYVPKDLTKKEPSTDNSEYVVCPPGGIRIPYGFESVLHANYIPKNSTNRRLTWDFDSNYMNLYSSNPLKSCVLNSTYTNCLSKATINGKKEGTTTVKVTTSNGKIGTCNVTFWDGSVDSVGCKDMTISAEEINKIETVFEPYNANKLDFKYTISDSTYLSIDSNTGKITGKNNTYSDKTVNVTVSASNGKTGTCKVTIKGKPSPSSGGGGGGSSGGGCGGTYCSGYVLMRRKSVCSKTCNQYGCYCVWLCLSEVVQSNSTSCGYRPPSSSGGSSSSGSGHKRPSTGGCFPKETSIVTIDGYKNIEDIEVGDKVLSYNEKTNKTEYKEVLKLFVHENYENYMYELTINGKILKVTGEHRIYIKNNYGINGEWIEVKDLKVGDKLMDKDNDIYMISSIKRYKYNNTVYNFEVEDNHNYYVTTDNYLVHNRKAMV